MILSCTVQDKAGPLQWTRNGFGLGEERDLPGYPRYSMIGSDELGENLYTFHWVRSGCMRIKGEQHFYMYSQSLLGVSVSLCW